ncbi:O-antigen polymerase [Myroides pelagicus]|uniref:O-antigen polymerase n=1 Tax=Myroides pelagicus TaxID=270914 RepID=UPI00398A7DB0
MEVFNSEFNILIGLIYTCSLIIFFAFRKRFDRNWLTFDSLFLIGFTIVHFQIPILAGFGIEPERANYIWINKEVVNFATWMSCVCIVLWMWGYLVSLTRVNGKKNYKFSIYNKIDYKKISFQKYDRVLLILFIAFIGLVGGSFFSGVYDGGESWGGGAIYIYLVLKSLLYLRIIYFFKILSEKGSKLTIRSIVFSFLKYKFFLFVLVCYFGLFLLSGDRGPILQISLIIGASYSIFIHKISFRKLFLFVFLGAFVFTILKFGRSREINEVKQGNIFERGYANYKNNDASVGFTDELAASVRIQYRALDVVPDRHPYLYGLTFVNGVLGAVPFASSTFMDLLDIPKEYTATTTFFTYLGQGRNPISGEGSEIIGDIYVNFGLYISFVIMFLFGSFVGRVYKRALHKDFNSIIVLIILTAISIYWSRSVLLLPLKEIVYILVINYIFTIKARKKIH